MSLFEELKRRNVFRVGIAYIVVAWLLAQVADLFLENFHAPDWVIQSLLVLLVILFPLALFFAWAFELTPEGVKKEKDIDRSQSITAKTGRKLDFAIIALLAMGLIYFFWESRLQDGTETGNAAGQGGVSEPMDSALEIPVPGSSPVSAPATGNSPNSIAVLPFVNMSGDADNEFFSDGVSEEILNVLARIPELKVAARTSAFGYKGTTRNISDIARELRVANILEGSVRKSGQQVRVTAQLIKADDGFHLWSATYDRQLDNIFAIQDEIATAIADALKVSLNLVHNDSGNLTGTNSLEAYEHYLQGMTLWHLRTATSLYSAIAEFDKAVGIDPGFARAHAGLAMAWVVLPGYTAHDSEELRAKALESANRALQLDPNLAEALTVLGQLASDALQYEESRSYFEQSIALNPSLATSFQWYARLLGIFGDSENALEKFQHAWDLDPRSRIIAYNYAWELMHSGQYEEAMSTINALLAFAPDFPDGQETAMIFNLIQNNCAAVDEHGNELVKLLGKTSNTTNVYVDFCLATDTAKRTALATAIAAWSGDSIADPDNQTLTYDFSFMAALVELGEFDVAFKSLERQLQGNDYNWADVAWLRSTRSPNGLLFNCDPRAVAVYKRAELPPLLVEQECE